MAGVCSGVQPSNISFTQKFSPRILKSAFLTSGCSRRDVEHPVQQSLLSRQEDRRRLRWEGHQNLYPGLHRLCGGLEVGLSLEASHLKTGGVEMQSCRVCSQNGPCGALRPGARRGHADHRSSPPGPGEVQGAAERLPLAGGPTPRSVLKDRLSLVALFQVGFRNDGKILAADFQFYANAGNTVDESLWVGRTSVPHVSCLLVLLSEARCSSSPRLLRRFCFTWTTSTTSPTCGAVLLLAGPTCPPTRPSGASGCPRACW